MIEKQSINGKEFWVKVDPFHVQRDNPNIIPTEYFTATYYMQEPSEDAPDGKVIQEDGGEPKLFESPVQALSYAWKQLETNG